VEKKINDVKHALIASRMMELPNDNINNVKDKLGVVFPIETMENFLLFEEAIATSQEKKKALVSKNIEITLFYVHLFVFIDRV